MPEAVVAEPAASEKPVLEGSCRWANCEVQHLHPVTGRPPDYHWFDARGRKLPRWYSRFHYREGRDPKQWWFTTDDVARTVNVGRRTVLEWIRSGHLEATRLPGGRNWRIKGENLDKFLRSTNRAFGKDKP